MFLLSCSKKIFIDTYHFDNIEKYLDKEVVFKYSERFESFVFFEGFLDSQTFRSYDLLCFNILMTSFFLLFNISEQQQEIFEKNIKVNQEDDFNSQMKALEIKGKFKKEQDLEIKEEKN